MRAVAAYHQAASDAGAQGDHHCRVTAFRGAGPVLTDGRTVGVVAQKERHIPLLLEQLTHRRIPEGHIGGLDHHAGPVVHQARKAGSHSLDPIQGHPLLPAYLYGQPDQLATQPRAI